ncbi:putative splicing factor [Candidozyma auris]|nr:putative splicing factor [[Candida] auris]
MTDIRDQDSEYMLAFSDDASSPSPETVNEHNRTTKPGNQNTVSEQDGQDENQTHRARTDLDERSVYLGNLHYAVLPIELEKFCSPMGKVDKVTIIVDRYSSLPTGIAFVAFKEKKSAEKAVEELDGKILHGRQTKVRAKVAKSSQAEERSEEEEEDLQEEEDEAVGEEGAEVAKAEAQEVRVEIMSPSDGGNK